jgi:hypothetical protein
MAIKDCLQASVALVSVSTIYSKSSEMFARFFYSGRWPGSSDRWRRAILNWQPRLMEG